MTVVRAQGSLKWHWAPIAGAVGDDFDGGIGAFASISVVSVCCLFPYCACHCACIRALADQASLPSDSFE